VESEVGKGSTFTFTLPQKAQQPVGRDEGGDPSRDPNQI
jgi:hypothetical protein